MLRERRHPVPSLLGGPCGFAGFGSGGSAGRGGFVFGEVGVEEVEQCVDDVLLLFRGEVPVVPAVGERDVADLARPAVVAGPAASGGEPVGPAAQARASVPQGVLVVAVQERFEPVQAAAGDVQGQAASDVREVLAFAHPGQVLGHRFIVSSAGSPGGCFR